MLQQIWVKALEFLSELIIDLFNSYFILYFQTLLVQVALAWLTIFLVPNLWFYSIVVNIKINNSQQKQLSEIKH